MSRNHAFPFPEKDPACLRILCLGDVVGKPGRQVLEAHLPGLRRSYMLDMVVANGENAAGGVGLTPETARELLDAGVDIITGGNHSWKHRELYPLLISESRLLRPANYPPGAPGKGMRIHRLPGGQRVAVVNLIGRSFMEALDCPFKAADSLLASAELADTPIRIIDFHAEATSEKRALAHYVNGRASAMLGTHTHVQTADAHLSANGTASLTDLGMCGAEEDSVLGVAPEPVISRFIKGLPASFRPSKGRATINGALLDIHMDTGKTQTIRLLRGPGESPSVFYPLP